LQLIHDFGISIETYFNNGRGNTFPIFNTCPSCKAKKRLARHGYYERYAICKDGEYKLSILRLKCTSCKLTFSILPTFLLARFLHSVKYIQECLREYFLNNRLIVYYQKIQFYSRRFLKNLGLIEMFFRSIGYHGLIPENTKEKAMKLMEMVKDRNLLSL